MTTTIGEIAVGNLAPNMTVCAWHRDTPDDVQVVTVCRGRHLRESGTQIVHAEYYVTVRDATTGRTSYLPVQYWVFAPREGMSAVA